MKNTDFEIELLNTEENEENTILLPTNFLLFGEIESDDLKVYIHQETYKKLEEFSKSDVNKELGSILIGDYCEEMGKKFVVISDYIEAKYTSASASTLTFTHETWEYVHKTHSEKFPDKKIIGWQHTHPGYGIFLSNYDMFIQENFFNLPFQVAYVIDPIQNLNGFFQWKNDKVQKLHGYNVYDDNGKPIKIQRKATSFVGKSNQHGKGMKVTVAMLSVLVIILGVASAVLGVNYFKQKSLLNEKDKIIENNSAVIEENSREIDNITDSILAKLDTSDKKEMLSQFYNIIKNGELKVNNSETILSELDAIMEKYGEKVYFTYYTVKNGDNLIEICEKFGLNYSKTKNLILGINGIKNADSIRVGSVLLLPAIE